MSNLDPKTLDYYSRNAVELVAKYGIDPDVNARFFEFAFPKHQVEQRAYKVLDIGCGTGRDLLRLLDMGYNAFGIDPCSEMRNVALSQSSALNGRILEGSFDDILSNTSATRKTLIKDGLFDGILLSAVLHHVHRSNLLSIILRLEKLLRPGGRIFMTIPTDVGDLAFEKSSFLNSSDTRTQDERIYNDLPPDWIVLLFQRCGYRLVDTWKNKDNPGRRQTWQNYVFSLERTDTPSGLESIEKIIQNDRKTSTNKLALLRALCEVALSNERVTHASHDGVHVPVRLVAEKFLKYYLPLIQNLNLPQITNKRLSFAASIDLLINTFERSHGPFRPHNTFTFIQCQTI